MKRREFLKGTGAALGAAMAGTWAFGCGDGGGGSASACRATAADLPTDDGVAHLLPTVSSDRILLKASLRRAPSDTPELRIDGCSVTGVAADSQGLHWVFEADGLDASRQYRLELIADGRHQTEPWNLATFPAPNKEPDRFRLLVYGCAGSHPIWDAFYNPAPIKRRLLQRALELAPDAAVVSGDHIYWDLRSGPFGSAPRAIEFAGMFDRGQPVLGTANEDVLKLAVGPQIADLYGTLFRSLPVFFQRDDHDYFEDDRANEELTTFPADAFSVELARASQWLYYPEFLPDLRRPMGLPTSSAPDRPPGVCEAWGTLRYGRLVEALLYDCKGFVRLTGDRGTVVPPTVEDWLLARMADREPAWVVNLPSNPPGWTAGKFAEWYPDVLGPDGELTTDLPKAGWQTGWLAQHDRLMAAATAMERLPLFMASDIHSSAEQLVLRSGELDLSANPVVTVIAGTPGTGVFWPSAARGTEATPPAHLDVEPIVPVTEQNGFTMCDFERDKVTIRHFIWDRTTDPANIDVLEPAYVSEHPRRV